MALRGEYPRLTVIIAASLGPVTRKLLANSQLRGTSRLAGSSRGRTQRGNPVNLRGFIGDRASALNSAQLNPMRFGIKVRLLFCNLCSSMLLVDALAVCIVCGVELGDCGLRFD